MVCERKTQVGVFLRRDFVKVQNKHDDWVAQEYRRKIVPVGTCQWHDTICRGQDEHNQEQFQQVAQILRVVDWCHGLFLLDNCLLTWPL